MERILPPRGTVTNGTHLFTYGTLMFPEVMSVLIERELETAPAKLSGYSRQGITGKVYPGIVRRDGSSVDGVLYLSLDPVSLAILDAFEDSLYQREELVVESSGKRVTAIAYVVTTEAQGMLSGESWNPDIFVTQSLATYLARSAEIGKRIRASIPR